MEQDIISEEQSEELEILEFKVGGNTYGMSVNNVREILPHNVTPTPIPNSHPFIEGIIMPRDILIPIVNLMKSLRLEDIDVDKNEMIIITNINDLSVAFHVDSVNGIHRIKNSDIKKLDTKLGTTVNAAVIGMIPKDDRKIILLDLQYIINEIITK